MPPFNDAALRDQQGRCARQTIALLRRRLRPILGTTRSFGGVVIDLSSSVRSPPAPFEAYSRSQPTRHPLRKLLRTHRADCHCRPRPAGAESSVWKTKKAANKRVTRCPSGIRLDWSGNRTGKLRVIQALEAARFTTWNGSIAVRQLSLYASKPSFRANFQEFPAGLPRKWAFLVR